MSIQGKTLVQHPDMRGYFTEMWRESWGVPIAQVSHSMMYQGVIKAWHWHERQTDIWYVVSGVLLVAVYAPHKDYLKEEILSGNGNRVLAIPREWWHGCKVLQGPCHLIYLTDREYDPKDEHRAPHDADPPGYDWLKGAPIT